MEHAQKLPDFADIFERVLVPAIFDRYARDLVERALPFGDRSFEVVLAQQVLQFVPDRVAAAREIRRVLVPGGRVIASTWRPRPHQPLFEALGQVAERHLGPGNDKRWALDGDELCALLGAAGFADVRLDTASLEERFRAFPIQASTAGAGYTGV